MAQAVIDWNRSLPLLPLRDIVVLPGASASLFVGRPRSVAALESAFAGERRMMLATQKLATVNDPVPADIHDVGCVARIVQIMRLPDGAVKALVEGEERARIEGYVARAEDDFFEVRVVPLLTDTPPAAVVLALRQSAFRLVEQLARVNENIPAELVATLAGTDDPGHFCDRAAANLVGRVEQKQALLAAGPLRERLELLADALQGEIEVAQI
ncbi:MAG: LON peptidase substrate-binding domain-containing protein, partial [Nitrospinae bacterium]|nr:LON peptidase substrate-binding domain-containing protein [Nitrospinota bacterium]